MNQCPTAAILTPKRPKAALSPVLKTYAEARVPRYTSYPTAPHFTAVDGAGHYAQWLADIPEGTPLSLYLHIPFCHQLCWYCGCHTSITQDTNRISAYADLLQREIDLKAKAMDNGRPHGRKPGPVHHIHFGGGSPNALSATDLRAIMARLRQRFQLAQDAEIAIELDPRKLSESFMNALGDTGITRASLGVQDLNPIIQKRINREQPFSAVRHAMRGLRHRGIEKINLDLMYGLPGQRVPHVLRTIEKALTLHPDRLAVFGYAHVPWFKKHQKLVESDARSASLPDTLERLDQAEAARQAITAAGYVEIGMDHYAKPSDPMTVAWQAGHRQRNFQGFTTDGADTLIGFGASAISSLPRGYAQNHPHLAPYRSAVMNGEAPITRECPLTAEDKLRRQVISDIMCEKVIDLGGLCRQHGYDARHFDTLIPALQKLADDGLILHSDGFLTLTHAGRRFSRSVAAVFDAYLHTGDTTTKHSQAS
ncbi:MAG: oxygen-independent coproporphyrinogen III oxidase [Pseudomonadota bacterium]